MADYKKDKRLQEFGMSIAKDFHEDKLDKAKFLFAFQSPAQKSGDRVVLGRAIKVSPMTRDLANMNADFIIIIAEDEWKDLADDKRMALIDHQLSHCAVHEDEKNPGKPVFKIAPHDLGEFSDVVRRHGIHCDEILPFVAAAKQGNLFKESK